MLKNNGYCVFALTYGALSRTWPVSAIGGMGPIAQSAVELSRFVDRVLAATHARTVDLVGHSQGTFMPAYYVKVLGGARKVTDYISLAPLWRGSTAITREPFMSAFKAFGGAPFCVACNEMAPNSAVSQVIWQGGSPYVDGIHYTNVSTRYDELVIPYTSGQVPGRRGQSVTNIVLQNTCAADRSDHLAVAGSRRAVRMVLNALDPAHRQPVPCMYVPPYTG